MDETIEAWTIEMIKKGVSQQHVESMKRKKLKSTYVYECYYDEIKKDNFPKLVDTEKIVGIDTAWITAGRSVYNLFFSVIDRTLDSGKESLHYYRIKENLSSLINNGLSYQYHFYVDKSKEHGLRDGLPKFKFFKDDNIYFSGATHRTISALMFNAPQMIGYVTTYKKNKKKFANFQVYEQIEKEWIDFIKKNELKHIELIKEHNNDYISVYSREIEKFTKQKLMKFNEPIFRILDIDFDDTDTIKFLKENTNKLICKIIEIDNVCSKRLDKVLKIPLVFLLLKRFKCYFLYNVLYMLYKSKYEKESSLEIYQPIDKIADSIQKKLCLYIINENRPIKRKNESY